jgi:phosphoglycerol transferase MdoB-like AlkP superfamily enzyme
MLYLLAAYALTLPAALVAAQVETSADLMAYLKLACLLAFAWHALLLYRSRQADALSRAALAMAAGLSWFAVLFVYLYKVVTMTPFVFSVAISSLDDSRETVAMTLGERYLPWALLAFIAVAAVCVMGAWLAMRATGKRILPMTLSRGGVLGCALGIFLLLAADALYVADELLLNPRSQWSERPLRSPDYAALRVASTDSVFVIQLESTSSSALFERSSDAAGYRRHIPLPGIERIVREGGGTFFPFFWANSIQTHRAQEAILCGISGNAGDALSLDPVRLQRRTCLPQHLANAGFTTVFLYAFFDMEFFNFGEFSKQVGFQQVAYGPQLMRPEDTKHLWGFDDCVFYERAFEHLQRTGLGKRERLFAYFEAVMNHWPFEDTKKHPQAHPYRTPATPLEHYRNSVAEQDHCLLTFWRKFRELGRDDIHLIIIPDHAASVEGTPSTVESTFGTWLAYVPPARRTSEPRVVLHAVPSQAQIYPTIIELLDGPRSPQSFAFLLQGKPRPDDYDACHLLANPYLSITAVRDAEQAELRYRSREVRVNGGPPVAMDYRSFHERYFCR